MLITSHNKDWAEFGPGQPRIASILMGHGESCCANNHINQIGDPYAGNVNMPP